MASTKGPEVAEIDEVNPMGTDGFEFVEYAAPDPAALGTLFEHMGFVKVAKHRSKDVSLYRQGDVNFIVNAEKDSFAQGFARVVHEVHPLLETAYHRLGYPDRSFDQVAAKALQRIVDAPVVEKTPGLVPKGANFAFADEKLEALGPVEKLLLRMGPRNTKLIQNKAREIAAALDFRIAQH